jgi:putative pyruvate formate lyase activating enzyme
MEPESSSFVIEGLHLRLGLSKGPGAMQGVAMAGGPGEIVRAALVPATQTRVYWRGVTLLEEHEIAPTYELYLTGCPLRCPFCAVPGASRSPRAGERVSPQDLAQDLMDERHPPFRSLAFVGGEPTLHLDWIRQVQPLLAAALPEVELVLNTALCWEADLAPELATRFDWVVGTLRCFQPGCAQVLGAPASHPRQARAAVEALLAAGARLILRLLVLPGHLECCARPLAAWISGLRGDLKARVMLNYVPVGEARGLSGLDRPLDDETAILARALLPPEVPRPAVRPLLPIPQRLPRHRDPPVSIEIDSTGRTVAPMVTGTILPWLAKREPSLRERLVYLDAHAR